MASTSSLWEALHHWADATPDAIALCLSDRQLSYTMLADAAEARALWLAERGVEHGDRVMIVGLNSIDWVVAYLAVMRLGAIAVPANNRLSGAQMSDLVQLLNARLVLVDDQHRPLFAKVGIAVHSLEKWQSATAVKNLPSLPVGDTPALISFTSGTTGQPKGAVLSQAALFEASAICQRYFATSPEDSTLVLAPMFHNTGFVDQFGQMLIAGGQTSLVREFHRREAIEAFLRTPASFVAAVPSVLRLLMLMDGADAVFRPAKTVFFGGSPMPAAWSRELMTRWPHLKLVHGYGLTEFGSACSFLPPDLIETHGESVGVAAPGVELKIVADDGSEVAPGSLGEVWVAGPTRMTEYWCRPDANAEKLSGKWLRTGDLGRFDPDGLLYLDGRYDDVINRGGEKILPSHLESLLSERPDVGTCIVVGIPDPILQQIPVAALEVRPDQAFDEPAARALMAASLPGYAVPSHFLTFDPLPRIASGKIDRRAVRDAIIARLSTRVPPSGEIE